MARHCATSRTLADGCAGMEGHGAAPRRVRGTKREAFGYSPREKETTERTRGRGGEPRRKCPSRCSSWRSVRHQTGSPRESGLLVSFRRGATAGTGSLHNTTTRGASDCQLLCSVRGSCVRNCNCDYDNSHCTLSRAQFQALPAVHPIS